MEKQTSPVLNGPALRRLGGRWGSREPPPLPPKGLGSLDKSLAQTAVEQCHS